MEQNRKVILVGAGGVGYWVSCALSRAGVKHTIYDADTFEGGMGYTRLPKVSNPATKKVTHLRGFCLAVMGDTPPTVVDKLFTGTEVEAGDLMVDCSDMELGTLRSKKSRKSIWKIAQERGARCLRISYDGKNNTVVVAEGLPLFGRKSGGYSERPGFALSIMAGGVGAIAVQKILSGYLGHIEFQIQLSDFWPEVAESAPVGVIEPQKVSDSASSENGANEEVVA
jgi:hypothetical protein